MKFGIWTANGALNSPPVFKAFAKGIEKLGHTCSFNTEADIEVIWSVLWHGRMLRNKVIWNRCLKLQKPLMVLEVGCFDRGRTWRLGLGGINRDANFGKIDLNKNRAKKLGLVLKDWQLNNGDILIAGQHLKSGQWKDSASASSYINDTIQQIRCYTDKKIIVRPHPRSLLNVKFNCKNVPIDIPKKIKNSYDSYFIDYKKYYTIFNYSSNPGIEAAIAGVPVFVGKSSLAYDVANHDISNILNPVKPDRNIWLEKIAYTEWTCDELETGYPIKRLTDVIF